MTYRMLMTGVIFAALSSSAQAQNTLGELLDMGGKKLAKEDVTAAIVGSRVGGPTKFGGRTEIGIKADGSLSGYLRTPDGRDAGLIGTWTVDDSGRMCSDSTAKFQTIQKIKGCMFFYSVSDRYYISESDSDRNARLLVRTISRDR
jgi:hypothetical protein